MFFFFIAIGCKQSYTLDPKINHSKPYLEQCRFLAQIFLEFNIKNALNIRFRESVKTLAPHFFVILQLI
ncbi:hypothetical protein EAX61_09460 [Dokdonia sinensis]|uniref:Uncharacterized protein n=1 Tax=Dokdonia sinensis TaxID=2479847 RepID=A0A3M0G7Z6_9FLAO|nr:hypothetical protein EAX61_09460 [Dokdonia sinensis]